MALGDRGNGCVFPSCYSCWTDPNHCVVLLVAQIKLPQNSRNSGMLILYLSIQKNFLSLILKSYVITYCTFAKKIHTFIIKCNIFMHCVPQIIRVMKPKVLEIVSEKTSAMMICVLKYEENNRSVDYEVRRGFTSVRDMSLVCSKGAICLAPEEDDDVCTGGIHHSADYGLELDSSDEDTPVTETPLYAAACLYETHECFENGLSREMARLMVDVQLQDNVSLNSLNSQSTRSSESIESTEDATETPLDRSFNYEPRHLIAWYNRDEVSQ